MQPQPPYPKFPEQDENGVDLSLIRSNLRLSPIERARRHASALQGLLWIRQNAKRIAKKST